MPKHPFSSPFWRVFRGTFLTALLLVFSAQAVAAPPGLGPVTGVTANGSSVAFNIGADQLTVRLCTPQIVRIDYWRNGLSDSDTPVIDPQRAWPGDPAATIDTSGSPIVLQTARLRVKIDRAPCRLSLFDPTGKPLLWEQSLGGVFVDAPSEANGGLRFNHAPGQNFYGIKAYDKDADSKGLLRNGNNTPDSTYQANASTQGGAGAPFVWTTGGFGVLVDSDNGYVVVDDTRLEFYYGSPPLQTNGRWYDKKHSIHYYLFVGEPKEVLFAAAQITGQPPMFPRWSMGFMNSEWGIDQAELLSLVDLYRSKDIPLDNYTLDFDWKAWGKDDFGEFRWNTDKFPGAGQSDGAGTVLKSELDRRGVKLTGIMKPRIVRSPIIGQDVLVTAQSKEAQLNDYWYRNLEKHRDYFSQLFVGELDFSKRACRTWYWNHLRSRGAFQGGIVGFWNDEADEANLDGTNHAIFNNFQHLHMQQALYEGQRAGPGATPARVWSINRNFYLGAQRFAYALWSGDIGSGFSAMERQSERLLTAVALGQAKWGMDTGSFGGNPSPQNYARWVQFSAFVPVFRVHGDLDKQRQPWVYGATAEEVTKNVIQLRYRLAPYVYAYERAAYETGVGIVRPLMVEFPQDRLGADQPHEWMFGEWLLVAPVLKPQLTQGPGQSTVQPIYLPPGTWVDYFRGEVFRGGRTIQYALNPGTWTDIPLFVRRGAVLPTQDVVRSLGEARPAQVYLDVFPDTQETGVTFYDDDGTTYAYEGDAYLKQRITTKDEGDAFTLVVAAKTGTYLSQVKSYLARLHGRAGTAVTLDGQVLAKVASLDALRTADQGWLCGRDIYGPLTYVKIRAGQAVEARLRVTGSEALLPTSERFEAEDASLSGLTPDTRARANTNHPGFTGTGFVEGLDQAEAAVTFSVKTKTAGVYPLTLRAANGSGQERTLSVYVNGLRTGPATIPQTTDWDTWTEVPVALELSAGNNIITWKRDTGDRGGVNLDSLTVPFVPAAAAYEAESAQLSAGANVNVDHRHYAGNGFVDGLTAPGAAATFTVYAAQDGDYTVTTRYANANGGERTLSLYVNGTRLKAVTLPPAPDWETWRDKPEAITLRAGANTLGFVYDVSDSGHVNLDRIVVLPKNGTLPGARVNLVDNGGFEAGTAGWTESHTVGPLSFGVDTGTMLTSPEYARFGDNRAYFYCPGAYAQQISQRVTVPSGGGNHRFEAWVRCFNTNPTEARVEVSGHGGSPRTVDLTPNDGKWRLVTIEHIPVTANHADITFSVKSPGGTTVQLDEVKLTKE